MANGGVRGAISIMGETLDERTARLERDRLERERTRRTAGREAEAAKQPEAEKRAKRIQELGDKDELTQEENAELGALLIAERKAKEKESK